MSEKMVSFIYLHSLSEERLINIKYKDVNGVPKIWVNSEPSSPRAFSKVRCSACNGTGKIAGEYLCKKCTGIGFVHYEI